MKTIRNLPSKFLAAMIAVLPIPDYLPLADGFIIGSRFRRDWKVLETLQPERLNKLTNVFTKLRKAETG